MTVLVDLDLAPLAYYGNAVTAEKIEAFAKEKFKGNCGFAQQYLFYSARQDA
jgi:hypothetical protein